MEGEWGKQPKIPETEAIRFTTVFMQKLRNELPQQLGYSDLNSGLISRDRKTVRMNFYTLQGKELTDAEWELTKEYALVVFSEIVVTPYDDTPVTDSVEIAFNDCDSEYDYKRTIIIRAK